MENLLDWIPPWLWEVRRVRLALDAFLLGRARRGIAALDRIDPARAQVCTLLGLVHQARHTRFGREHDFHRIRTPEDFRRLVPLRNLAEHGHGSSRGLQESLADRSAAPSVALRRAAWTALGLVTHARPRARLLDGQWLFAGEGAAWEAPAALRSGLLVSLHVDSCPPTSGESRLAALAQASVKVPVTCVAGPARSLLRLFAHLKQLTGRKQVADIWPGLSAVMHSQAGAHASRADLVREVGEAKQASPVLFLEAWTRPEGAIAIEDPRYGRPRLLTSHGVYFEFVPLEHLGKPNPVRHGLDEIEQGVRYALAMTSPPGLWACLLGLEVCFERRDPPLLRIVAIRSVRPADATPVHPPSPAPRPAARFPLQPPHRAGSKLSLPLLKER
jgi:hypothetical protein